ncbi:MAG: glycosyltransferase [Actinomycetota bacterium]|nr:glycosyltransferase [Actinomycetota bacterium]
MSPRRPRRVLLSLFGSAGDLLPLLRLAIDLKQAGNDVRMAVTRSLSLYTRTFGIAAVPLGIGAEMRVFSDPEILTCRFNGWASWRRLMNGYIAPTLKSDVAMLSTVVESWRPDVVVAGSFSVAGRIIAQKLGLALVEFSIYPQHVRAAAASSSGRIARELRTIVGALLNAQPHDARVTRAIWAAEDTFLLHDPKLLGDGHAHCHPVIGFPYWDGVFLESEHARALASWTTRSSRRPTVLVTPGSFLGARQHDVWTSVVRDAQSIGARVVLAGPRSEAHAAELGAPAHEVLAVGAAPLSGALTHVDAVVHHGGIGTTFASIRAGRPAVVIPQAFDQSENGQLLERAGAGMTADRMGVRDALVRVLDDPSFAKASSELRSSLLCDERARRRMSEEVLARTS